MLPAITVESLKEDKGFAKTAKKYGKEYDGLQKKQNKERNSVSANQCKAMEKLIKSKKCVYFVFLREINFTKNFVTMAKSTIFIHFLYFFHRKENLGNDPDVLKLVREQTTQWTDLMHRQRKSEWEMLKTHVTAQEETLKKLASQLQVKQMKDLEANFTK